MHPSAHNEYGEGSISVALCTYNGSRYLRDQLESIGSQTLLPSELVVCDDGSRDETITLIEQFSHQVSFPVRVFRNEKNLGSTQNFEKAIRLCRGEFIALSDQDDWWSPTKLEVLSAVFEDPRAGAVFSDGLLMGADSKLTGGTLWSANRLSDEESGFNKNSGNGGARSTLLRNNVVTGATVVFRSRLREKILPFPIEWVHDGWLAWMIVLHSELRAVAEPLIHYRTHGEQQVGVPGQSLGARLRRARDTGMEDYLSIERQFGVLLRYVQSHPGLGGPDLVKQLEEKRRLSSFRARLPQNRFRRWGEIAAQASSYRVYSQGWRSMMKDGLV